MELESMFLKKTPPHSIEAERTVLGGILVNNKSLNVVLSVISQEDFYKDANRKIIEKIILLVDKGLRVDLLSLAEELKKGGYLDEVGGVSYLSSLMDGVPKSLNIEYHAQIINSKVFLSNINDRTQHLFHLWNIRCKMWLFCNDNRVNIQDLNIFFFYLLDNFLQ